MAELYDIDLLRQVFVDELQDESIFFASFYEQIKDEQEINRYVEKIQDLVKLQNQDNYKAIGVITQSGSADIMNLKSRYILPMAFSLRLDINLEDRDYVLGKMKSLISGLKGRKKDILLLDDGTIVVLKTPEINVETHKPYLVDGMMFYDEAIDNWEVSLDDMTYEWFVGKVDTSKLSGNWDIHVYFEWLGSLMTARLDSAEQTISKAEITTQYTKHKASMSFTTIQSEEPFIADGIDRTWLVMEGQATITDGEVGLGNDIVSTGIKYANTTYEYEETFIQEWNETQDYNRLTLVNVVVANANALISYLQSNPPLSNVTIVRGYSNTGTPYYVHCDIETYVVEVEPTAISSGVGSDDDSWQEWSGGYPTKTSLTATAGNIGYDFVYDRSVELLKKFYKFGRFGVIDNPNLDYVITEHEWSFGELIYNEVIAKLVDVKVQNTNGDVMTISCSFKVSF